MIVVTHEMGFARPGGRPPRDDGPGLVIEEGPPEQLLHAPEQTHGRRQSSPKDL